jgi:prephenate dehydrogenase
LAQAIDAVRADAGHLFATIQRENPFAADSRERLLASLQDIHATLDTAHVAANTTDAVLGEGSADARLDASQQLAEVEAELIALQNRRNELRRRASDC